MKENTKNLPMDFSVVSQPYTVLKHLNAVKEMMDKAKRICDDFWKKSKEEREFFLQRTVENSPVKFHGWHIDVDPENGHVYGLFPVGRIDNCVIVLTADEQQKNAGYFTKGNNGHESYIYLRVSEWMSERDLKATLVHELTHYFDYKEGRTQSADDLVSFLHNREYHDNDILQIYGDVMYVLWSPTEIRAYTSMLAVDPIGYYDYRHEVNSKFRDFADQLNDYLCHFGTEAYDKQSEALDECFMDKDGLLSWLKTPGGFTYMTEQYALPAISLAKKAFLDQFAEKN